MKLIVALTKNEGLGKDNELLVKNKADMKHFKDYTLGNSIVMGRKTWESIGTKPLPLRTNYVITSQPYCSEHPDVIFIKSLSEAPDDAIVIGGRQVYLTALADDRLKEISLTLFNEKKEADVYLTELTSFLVSPKCEFAQTGYKILDNNAKLFTFEKKS